MDDKEAKEIRDYMIQQAMDFIEKFVDDEEPKKMAPRKLMLDYQGLFTAYSNLAVILGYEIGKIEDKKEAE